MRLQEPHKRRIDYLRISVTDRCNLSCVYCKPRKEITTLSHNDILRYEEILRLVGIAIPLGITRVRVTGSEPLLRRGIVDFLISLKQCNGIEDVSLTTNDLLLEEMAGPLLAAGITRLNISLDSLNPERFHRITGNDSWDKVWRGINKAETIGFFPLASAQGM
jgi:cyclic pyranopterin phosphate synthase